MSVNGIRAVIRNHTGAHASDTVKITHEEVLTMIRATKDHRIPNAAERAELMAALAMFGGNDIHPDIFSSAEDKAAVEATAVKGIETAERFEALSPGEQVRFIWDCLLVGAGYTVGFTTTYIQISSLSAPISAVVDSLLQAERSKAGPRYEDDPYTNLQAFARGGDTYAYALFASWERSDQKGSWDATNYLGRQGELLKSTAGYTPPDPPDTLLKGGSHE